MNKLFALLSVFSCCLCFVRAADYEVISPDKQLKMIVHIDGGTTYELWHGETQLITPSAIALNLADGTVVGAGTIKDTHTASKNNTIDVPIGKNKTLTEAYNELTVEYNGNYKLVVRAYNEGVAYRFVTDFNKEIIINSEDANFNFSATTKVYFPECDANTSTETGDNGVKYSIHQGYRNFERTYNTYTAPIAIKADRFSVTPVLFEYTGTSFKVVVTEAATYDYPGMYMERSGTRAMRGMWAGYPKSVMDPNNYYSNHLVYEREDYIAKTEGSRTFPWRVIIAANDDKSLLNNELVYLLAEPSRITDTSWIKPGISAWEWWHKAMLEGVPFSVGNNNLSVEMYKYYIDWAAQNGLEYMTLDAGYQDGWLRELCNYGKERNVKIIAWTWASCVREYSNGDYIKRMKNYGVAGLKIDFFERNDQVAMTWGYEFAERLAEQKMVGLYHGCPVPTGMNRTYPNILNFEAVRGAEDNFWRSIVTPDYHTQFPFIRALAGPMDYTPGSMRNTTINDFYPVDRDNTVPMSMGTRAHELSMYVVFDQWLGYMCDSPTEYNKFPDVLNFIANVPTVWDKTVPLAAELGKYILIAKQTGNDWHVGGMSNWDARTVEVNFDFLPSNATFEAIVIRDAPESGNEPKKSVCETKTISNKNKITVDMAKGGGFVIYLKNVTFPSVSNATVSNIVPVSTYVDRTSGVLHVQTAAELNSVRIYDLSGKCLIAKSKKDYTTTKEVDISGLERGIYIATLQTKQKPVNIKFIY